ncbi:hypothetical protein SBA2_180020 [Acidobacteriia bacterium SbA2]|nr:hypothetical protein SBA2_180020 [Acidobacteriia bacterium SbA2]
MIVDSIDPVGITVASAMKVRMQNTPTRTTNKERTVSHALSRRLEVASGFSLSGSGEPDAAGSETGCPETGPSAV